jgi:hypothetical protein
MTAAGGLDDQVANVDEVAKFTKFRGENRLVVKIF